MRASALVIALIAFGCDTRKGDTGSDPTTPAECPLDVPLDGDELPCTCGGERIDALPGDGTTCTCDSVADFTCV